MNLNEFQAEAMTTAVFPLDDSGWDYILSALPEELGEFSAIFAKAARKGQGRKLNAEQHKAAKHELGDLLWGLALAARLLDTTLDDIAKINLAKLEKRAREGKIEGHGDYR